MTQQYRHFKGNLYTLINVGKCPKDNEFYAIYKNDDHPSSRKFGVCRHSETMEIYYAYPSGYIDKWDFETVIEDAEKTGLWIRPLDMFFGYHESGVRRFEMVKEGER